MGILYTASGYMPFHLKLYNPDLYLIIVFGLMIFAGIIISIWGILTIIGILEKEE